MNSRGSSHPRPSSDRLTRETPAASPLDRLAARAASYSQFVAQALRHLTDAELLVLLGCTPETLTRLKLCGVPRDAGDVLVIAEHLGLDPEKLRAVLGV